MCTHTSASYIHSHTGCACLGLLHRKHFCFSVVSVVVVVVVSERNVSVCGEPGSEREAALYSAVQAI